MSPALDKLLNITAVLAVAALVFMAVHAIAVSDDGVNIKVAESDKPSERFAVESFGTFRAGSRDSRREIVVLTDSESGRKYLFVTGCGGTEMVRDTKQVGKAFIPSEREE